MPHHFPTLPAPLAALHGGLIVSCQALPHEPLFGADIMARLAVAAQIGGAVGLRANTPDDIAAIKDAVPNLPLIGLWKVDVFGFADVYITPRLGDALAVARAGADIIAVDATLRPHPEGSAADLIRAVKTETGKLVMADIATWEEAKSAADAGADIISTTLSGYTANSPQISGPDLELVKQIAALGLPVPHVAEGRIATPNEAREALDAGAWAVVVGGAITRPAQITVRFADALSGKTVK